MTALDDAEPAAPLTRVSRGGSDQNGPSRPRGAPQLPAWLPSRRFISAIAAIGGMQLLATMDSTVAIVALPKIQE